MKVRLINKDCFEAIESLEDGSINLIVTDPPFAIGFNDAHSNLEKKWDNMTRDEYSVFMKKWLDAVYLKLTDDGQIWFFFAPTMFRQVLWALDNTPYKVHWENWSVMARSKGRGSSKKLKSLREDYIHLTKSDKFYWDSVEYLRRVVAPYREKGGKKRGWYYAKDGKTPVRFTGSGNVTAWCSEHPVFIKKGEKHRGAVLDIASGERLLYDGTPCDVSFFSMPSVNNTFEKQIHSCQKPIMLLTMLIMLSSKEGDTVLDPFMGSGSCGVASVLSDRNFIGIEREKEVFDKAKGWIKNIDYEKATEYISNHVKNKDKFLSDFDGKKINFLIDG